MQNDFIIDESNPNTIKDILRGEIREYNRAYLGEYDLKHFSIYKNNNKNKIIAGIYGFILEQHHTMRLEFVWVNELLRKQGIGTALLQAVEHYALQKNCKFIQVNTMAFQGPAFYEKMGYHQIGCAPKWFCGQDELFFIKEL